MAENLIVKNCTIDLYLMDWELVTKQKKSLHDLTKNDNITVGEMAACSALIDLLTITQQTAAHDVVFPEIDFTMLKRHKMNLLKLTAREWTSEDEIDTIEGMLNFLDTIQDQAIEKYKLPKNRVFYFPKETVEHAK